MLIDAKATGDFAPTFFQWAATKDLQFVFCLWRERGRACRSKCRALRCSNTPLQRRRRGRIGLKDAIGWRGRDVDAVSKRTRTGPWRRRAIARALTPVAASMTSALRVARPTRREVRACQAFKTLRMSSPAAPAKPADGRKRQGIICAPPTGPQTSGALSCHKYPGSRKPFRFN